MNSMNMAVYASVFVKQLAESTGRPAERCEPDSPSCGLRDLLRAATAVGALAASAVFLVLATH